MKGGSQQIQIQKQPVGSEAGARSLNDAQDSCVADALRLASVYRRRYAGRMADKLSALIVDSESLARDEFARALGPYVRFTSSGGLLLEPAFDQLSSEHRVLCVLLALQAMRLLGLRDSDEVTPAQITEISGMPPGTVRPKLSALLKARWVVKGTGGLYSLPLHSARRAVALLGGAP
jgi:hypothetical protein